MTCSPTSAGGSQGLGGRTLGGEGTSFRGRKAVLSLGLGQAPSSPDGERHLPPSWCSYHSRRPNTQDAVGVLRLHTARVSRPYAFPGLPGNLKGKPWPDTANGLSFEEEPLLSTRQVPATSSL